MTSVFLNLVASLLLNPSVSCAKHGLSADLGHGVGYTYLAENAWGGISVDATKRRFEDTQLILHPRAYVNYQFHRVERIGFFGGLGYQDDFGLRNDALVDKHRVFSLTAGLSATIVENFMISTWLNVWAIRDDLYYDPANRMKHFDVSRNQQSFGDFGGLLLTYIF